ncbi:MAG TPA: hypothetical protein VGO14_04655 [Solirubrobacteraceae bacterium]|nr:hypothetical protein [Solirubrobacteraceae bacterium]
MQFRLEAHRQQQRPHRLPVRRGLAPLDAADGSLRQAGAPRERALAEAQLFALLADQ